MKKYILFTLIAILVTLIIQTAFGPFIAAKLSTISFIRKYNLVRQQAPIVINTREEVRVSDSEDIVAAFNKAKSKISTVVSFNGQESTILGTAINLAPEGIFVTSKLALPGQDISQVYVQSGDSVAKVQAVAFDPASNIAILKTAQTGISPASLTDSTNLSVGDRVVFPALLDKDVPYFLASFVASKEMSKSVANADTVNRFYSIQAISGLYYGQAIVNLSGETVGMWDGVKVIPSSVIRQASSRYFAHGGVILRPSFGFNYRVIPAYQSKITGQSAVVQVAKSIEGASAIAPGSPADKAGLKLGDIITAVAGTKVSSDIIFETLFEKINPGDDVVITVVRGTDTLELQVQAGELK